MRPLSVSLRAQVEQAKLHLVLGRREELDDKAWVVRLFRSKDRDHSSSLGLGEFVAALRRYGKLPRQDVSDVDLRTLFGRTARGAAVSEQTGEPEIHLTEFEHWLQSPPSKELAAFRAATARRGAPPPVLRVRSLGEREISRLWSSYDWNQNQKLSLAEMDKAIRMHPPKGWAGLTNKKALLLAFRTADVDWSGYVSRREFGKLLKYTVYFHMLWEQFDALDADGDHRLDLGEFKRCCEQMHIGDTDGDGVLSNQELQAAFSEIE